MSDRAKDSRPGAARLGAELRRLRRHHGLSGQQLAELIDVSQSTISRIETGATVATPHDVEIIGRALGETTVVIERLKSLAANLQQAPDSRTDRTRTSGRVFNPKEMGPGGWQAEFQYQEQHSGTIKMFQHALIPGLLQTSEYARTAISRGATVYSKRSSPLDTQAAVTERMRRQEVLDDDEKEITFLMLERTLRYPLAAPVTMLDQIEKIRRISEERENVHIAIIPDGAPLAVPPLHSFEIFDDQRALIELVPTMVTLTGPDDVDPLLRMFEIYHRQATEEIGAMLAEARAMYLADVS